MDSKNVLSEVVSTLHLAADVYFLADFCGPFAVEVPSERRRVRFHLVRQGRCWVRVAGHTPAPLGEGDLAIIPNGRAQVLSTDPQGAAVALGDILRAGPPVDGVLRHGAGDRRTRLLCGFCRFDEAIDHPVLTALPDLLVVAERDLGAEPWAAATLRLLALEADLNAQGTTAILGRLMEIVLIQAVRRLAGRTGDGGGDGGFMAALADRHLAQALGAIHASPQTDWTVGTLAALAGMSRARFAGRFTAIVGVPPAAYLTTWRLIKARSLLATTPLDMAEVAARCGYASVPSFTRRFKAAFGTGPGAYRRASRPQ